jgi:hypothetical protein
MKNLILLLGGAALMLSSCGGAEEALNIDRNGIKGTISAPVETRISDGTQITNDGEFGYVTLEFDDKTELKIVPEYEPFEDQLAGLEAIGTDGSFEKVEILSKDENTVFYKRSVKPFGEEGEMTDLKDGWGFVVRIKNGDKAYLLSAAQNNPLDPVWDEARAKELFEMAKSFKPE